VHPAPPNPPPVRAIPAATEKSVITVRRPTFPKPAAASLTVIIRDAVYSARHVRKLRSGPTQSPACAQGCQVRCLGTISMRIICVLYAYYMRIIGTISMRIIGTISMRIICVLYVKRPILISTVNSISLYRWPPTAQDM
jgi:hypothetical protein